MVSGLVAFFGLTVQVGRNRQFAHSIQYFSKADMLIIPFKFNELAGTVLTLSRSLEDQGFVLYRQFALQGSVLPLLLIADDAQPRTASRSLKHLLVVSRSVWLQEENLD